MQSLRVAVVGAGPAGLYTAEALTYQHEIDTSVDVIDRLPAPFGLLRYGVAPDHLKMKSLAAQLQSVLEHPRVRFVGNVAVGADVQAEELRAAYHAVIYAFGAAADRRLAIPGEELVGSLAAREFVAWYSGHPDAELPAGLLEHRQVAVVGMGNVALDVARILAHPPGALADTDAPRAVVDRLGASPVEVVHVVGRGGPADVKFGFKELRELAACPGIQVEVDPGELDLNAEEAARVDGDPARRRIHGLLREIASSAPLAGRRRVRLHFRTRPAEVLGVDRVAGLRLERVDRTEMRVLDVGLVLRAAGYRGSPLTSVPFDESTGTIPSRDNRVVRDGIVSPGEYATGWIGRGPTGLIGANRSHGQATADAVLADAVQLTERDLNGIDLTELLTTRGCEIVTGDGWRAIDQAELALGARWGTTRTKVVSRSELLEAARGVMRT